MIFLQCWQADIPCLAAIYIGTEKAGIWPATLEMCTMRLGLLGLTLPVLEVGVGFSQREMAIWVVRIGCVRLMSRQA